MYSTVKRMDDCEYTTKKIIVPLKEGITGTNWNKHTTVDRTTQAKNYRNIICLKLSVIYNSWEE